MDQQRSGAFFRLAGASVGHQRWCPSTFLSRIHAPPACQHKQHAIHPRLSGPGPSARRNHVAMGDYQLGTPRILGHEQYYAGNQRDRAVTTYLMVVAAPALLMVGDTIAPSKVSLIESALTRADGPGP